MVIGSSAAAVGGSIKVVPGNVADGGGQGHEEEAAALLPLPAAATALAVHGGSGGRGARYVQKLGCSPFLSIGA